MTILPKPVAHTHELGPVQFTALATPSRGTKQTTLWKIDVPAGAPPTPHALSNEELFIVTLGSAIVRMEGEELRAEVGDCIVIPAETVFELTNGGAGPLSLLSCMPSGTEVIMGEARFIAPWTA
jgi:mannose-6-phosphate isomerase-like protein (cupin superfamily)